MKSILSIFLLTISIFAHAQDVSKLLSTYFDEVRSGKYPSMPKHFSQPEYADKLLKAISVYEADTSARVRSKAYSIIRLAGTKSTVASVREQAVGKLVKGIQDKDVANVGTVLTYLTEFKKRDFNKTSLDNIKARFTEKPPHFSQLIRLVGFLDLTDLKDNIRTYSTPGNSRGDRWSAILALSRMGDGVAIDDMMSRVKKLPVNDNVVMELFPDLIYTRQKVALDYLVEVMRSDENNCLTPGEDERPVVCGYRIMEQLAPVVEGYPLELDESGDIKTKDYKEALITVRAWFDNNRNYSIKKE